MQNSELRFYNSRHPVCRAVFHSRADCRRVRRLDRIVEYRADNYSGSIAVARNSADTDLPQMQMQVQTITKKHKGAKSRPFFI